MRLLTVLVLGMVLFGCGSSNLTGTFVGNTTTGSVTHGAQSSPEQITMTLALSGGILSGTWSSVNTQGTSNGTGTVTGSADGNNVTQLQLIIPAAAAGAQGGGCSGTVLATGSYANWILTLNFNGGTTSCGASGAMVVPMTKITR